MLENKNSLQCVFANCISSKTMHAEVLTTLESFVIIMNMEIGSNSSRKTIYVRKGNSNLQKVTVSSVGDFKSDPMYKFTK